jgi:hypothetical protein
MYCSPCLDEKRAEGGVAEADITRTRAEGPQEVLLRGDPEGRRCERRTVRLKKTVAVAGAVFASDGGGGAEVETLAFERTVSVTNVSRVRRLGAVF